MTKTLRRLLSLLETGPCTMAELKQLLDDELAGDGCVRVHLHRLRGELRRSGRGIKYVRVRKHYVLTVNCPILGIDPCLSLDRMAASKPSF